MIQVQWPDPQRGTTAAQLATLQIESETMPILCQIVNCISPARDGSDFCFDHREHHKHASLGAASPAPAATPPEPGDAHTSLENLPPHIIAEMHATLRDLCPAPPPMPPTSREILGDTRPAAPAVTPADTTTAILTERGSRYGKFADHARITQKLKGCMAAHAVDRDDPQIPKRTWDALDPDQREALEMIAHKIGRILNGDPDYEDSWRDIAGYAQLVADRLKGISR